MYHPIDKEILKKLLLEAYEKYAPTFISKFGLGEVYTDVDILIDPYDVRIGLEFPNGTPLYIYTLKVCEDTNSYCFYPKAELLKYYRLETIKHVLND
jgi:hypothetical protein